MERFLSDHRKIADMKGALWAFTHGRVVWLLRKDEYVCLTDITRNAFFKEKTQRLYCDYNMYAFGRIRGYYLH